MLKLGDYNNLIAYNKTKHGIYLEDEEKTQILLPSKECKDINIGDVVNVFVYKDSEDRLIATTKRPLIRAYEIAHLKVVDTSKIGAFLDWGLDRDLFLPFKEQLTPVNRGKKYFVALYIDKSERLCATMKIRQYLKPLPETHASDVEGLIYNYVQELGYFVAIDNKYIGLIPNREAYGELAIGAHITGRIIRRDGDNIYISVRKKAKDQILVDTEKLNNLLIENGGKLDIGDKSDPQKIKELTGFSKNEFKRAAGRLYKEGSIIINDENIMLTNKED